MTVWVVWSSGPDGGEILGLFSTLDAASDQAMAIPSTPGVSVMIENHEVDQP